MILRPLPKRIYYALKSLCCFASAQAPVRAASIARCARIPPTQAAKILYILTWSGFVSSRRGSKGGFWLRVRPEQIRLRDVVEFFLPPGSRRRKQRSDRVLQVWEETTAPTDHAFSRLTLADLVKGGSAAQVLECAPSQDSDWGFFA